MSRFRENRDKIGEYEDNNDNINAKLSKLKEKIAMLEERLGKSESILKIIYYESNPAYLEGLKIKYEKLYGGLDDK